MILILEDDPDRVRRFARVLRREAPACPVLVWRDAHRMAAELGQHLGVARLISLDHDLEPGADDPPDLGDGLVVVRALVRHPQPCPTIIHSSNGTRSDWMAGEFELEGWDSHRADRRPLDRGALAPRRPRPPRGPNGLRWRGSVRVAPKRDRRKPR